MSSNPPQSGNQGQSTATPAASTQPASSTPLAATQAPARSYANATKKSATDSTAAPVTVGGSAQHGQSSSVSVNGKPMQNQSQQSASSGVTIVNGAPTASAAPSGDHSRKPSVTITSSGTSGYMPNGGGPASRPNSLQFGFQQSSPNMGAPAVPASNQAQAGLGAPSTNPRVTSPQTSPSPIPQPASSGGRPPPSTYQAQGNVPNFGSFGESADANVSLLESFPLLSDLAAQMCMERGTTCARLCQVLIFGLKLLLFFFCSHGWFRFYRLLLHTALSICVASPPNPPTAI